jgi:glycerate 2-kinase
VPAPLTASSRGVGELILAAVRMRSKRVVLGLGGVASTDDGAALTRLAGIDLSKLRDLSGIEIAHDWITP